MGLDPHGQSGIGFLTPGRDSSSSSYLGENAIVSSPCRDLDAKLIVDKVPVHRFTIARVCTYPTSLRTVGTARLVPRATPLIERVRFHLFDRNVPVPDDPIAQSRRRSGGLRRSLRRFRARGHFLFWRGIRSIFRPCWRRDSPMLTRIRRTFSWLASRLSKGNETRKRSFFTGVCSGIELPVTARPSGRTRELVAKPEDRVRPDNLGTPVISPSGRDASSTGPLPHRFHLNTRRFFIN